MGYDNIQKRGLGWNRCFSLFFIYEPIVWNNTVQTLVVSASVSKPPVYTRPRQYASTRTHTRYLVHTWYLVKNTGTECSSRCFFITWDLHLISIFVSIFPFLLRTEVHVFVAERCARTTTTNRSVRLKGSTNQQRRRRAQRRSGRQQQTAAAAVPVPKSRKVRQRTIS